MDLDLFFGKNCKIIKSTKIFNIALRLIKTSKREIQGRKSEAKILKNDIRVKIGFFENPYF